MKNQYCIIMAGGVGSRFWPMSTTSQPKQFLDILGTGRTLIQQTFDRFIEICPINNIYIVTNEIYKSLVLEQIPELNPENILTEPYRKNTAPCVAYASYKIHKLNPEAVTIVAPSDHLITKEDTFKKAINSSVEKAQSEDCLVTLGIKPSKPETGYGYIQFIDSPIQEQDNRMFKVKTFTEKPDYETAKFFIETGEFLWNSGIFVWKTKSIIAAFEKHDNELAAIFKEGNDYYNTPQEQEFIKKAYQICKNDSIDYSVMEKAKNVYVRSSIIGWSDLGTWGSLYSHIRHDANNNALVGKNILQYNCNNCIVHVPKDKLVVLQGLEDYIVAESNGVLMVCKKEDEQQIRNFVNDVKVQKGDKFI